MKEEELYYPCSENKGDDQLRSYCEADLHLCFCVSRFLMRQLIYNIWCYWCILDSVNSVSAI